MPTTTTCSVPGCGACETFPTAAEAYGEGTMPIPDGAPVDCNAQGWRGVLHGTGLFYFCPAHVDAVGQYHSALDRYDAEERQALAAYCARRRVEFPPPAHGWSPWKE